MLFLGLVLAADGPCNLGRAAAAFMGIEVLAGFLRRCVVPLVAWGLDLPFDAFAQPASMVLCFALLLLCLGVCAALVVAGDAGERSAKPAVPEGGADRAVAVHAARGNLTPKETEVLAYLMKGYTFPAIAKAQSLSLSTVQSHARSLYAKLGVHSRQELVELAEKDAP